MASYRVCGAGRGGKTFFLPAAAPLPAPDTESRSLRLLPKAQTQPPDPTMPLPLFRALSQMTAKWS
jgi:hypothetical protein